MNCNKKNFSVIILLLILSFFVGHFVFATSIDGAITKIKEVETKADLYSVPSDSNNPGDDVNVLIGIMLRYFFGIIGSLALLVFFYGAIMWMMASGNAQKISDARKTMIWAAIGLFAVFSAFQILNFGYEYFTAGVF